MGYGDLCVTRGVLACCLPIHSVVRLLVVVMGFGTTRYNGKLRTEYLDALFRISAQWASEAKEAPSTHTYSRPYGQVGRFFSGRPLQLAPRIKHGLRNALSGMDRRTPCRFMSLFCASCCIDSLADILLN
jgi:hypothetical protein